MAPAKTTKFLSIFFSVGGSKILSKAKRRIGILELSTGFYAIPLAIAICLCLFYNFIFSFNSSVSSACFKPSMVYFHKKKALREVRSAFALRATIRRRRMSSFGRPIIFWKARSRMGSRVRSKVGSTLPLPRDTCLCLFSIAVF